MKIYKTILACGALFFAACEQAEPLPQSPAVPAAFEAAITGLTFARAPEASQEDKEGGILATVKAMETVFTKADGWRDAHVLAQAEIEASEQGIVRASVEQGLAKLLLTTYLIPNQEEEGASEVGLLYSRALVEHGSPETEVVLQAVEAFGSEWDRADVRTIAIGGAEAAEQYAARPAPCLDCALPDEVRNDFAGRGLSSEVANTRRLNAAERLRAVVE